MAAGNVPAAAWVPERITEGAAAVYPLGGAGLDAIGKSASLVFMSVPGTRTRILPLSNPAAETIASEPPETLSAPGFGWLGATFRALRHRNYRLYFVGQLISLVGSWMQTTALMWLAYELTKQSRWPAAIAAANLLPTFFLGPWGGSIADRWPKRAVILATQSAFMLQAFALAWLVLAGAANVGLLLVLSLASGLIQAIDLPARLAFVTEMVGRDDLMNAVALNSLLFNVARAIGPALAGPLLVRLGAGHCFLVNAVSFVAVLWALARMDPRPHPSAVSAEAPHGSGSWWNGFSYLAGKPQLAFLTVLAGVVGLCGWPYLALLPALANNVLAGGSSDYSDMLTATGLGALSAALVIARSGSAAQWRRFIAGGVGIIAAGLIGLSMVQTRWPAVACCAAIGFGLIMFMATGQSVVQLGARSHNRGRVMAIWAMVLSGAAPVGNVLAGRAADHFGEPIVLRVLGVSCAAAAVMLWLLLRLWLRFKSPYRSLESSDA